MILSFLNNLQIPETYQTVVVAIIGVVTAGATLLGGRSLIRRLRPQRRPTTLLEGHDPFDQGSAAERRGAVRRKGNHVEALVTDAEAEEEPRRGWVVDRSMGGLCLLLSHEVAPGTVLSVKPRQAPTGTPWVRVEVRSCKALKGTFEVGCQFQRTPAWNVMLLFG